MIDRALIREILIDRRAPACDLEYLTETCPSVLHAEDYRATGRDVYLYTWQEPT